MIRLNPASRAFLLAAGLVVASVTMAAAEEAAPAAEAPPAEKPFSPTIYFGPSFGYADQRDSDFGWAMHALMRPLENLGLQIEYNDLGESTTGKGQNDFAYFGLAPMYRVIPRLDIFAQVGFVVGDAGDDVAAGAGLMYALPIKWLDENNVNLELLTQYKYLNVDDGYHLVTVGFLLGFHK